MSDAYPALLLAGQRAALESVLPAEAERQVQARRRITRMLEAKFRALATALAPAVVAEIGAHEGSFAKAMKAALPDTRVVAMEANPEVHAANADALEQSGVEYLHTCVASDVGRRVFSVPVRADGTKRVTMGSLLSDSKAVSEATYEVQSQRLDDLVGAEDNVLWIDVEGGVGEVLMGAEATLSRSRAVYVEVESRERWKGQWTDARVIQHLEGRSLFPILRDIQQPWQYNLLFIHADLFQDRSALRACGL